MTTNADVLTKQHKFQVSKKVATRTLQTTLGDGLPSAKFYCSRAKLILITGGAKRLSHQQSPRYRNRTHFRKSANVCFGISADAIGTCRCLWKCGELQYKASMNYPLKQGLLESWFSFFGSATVLEKSLLMQFSNTEGFSIHKFIPPSFTVIYTFWIIESTLNISRSLNKKTSFWRDNYWIFRV